MIPRHEIIAMEMMQNYIKAVKEEDVLKALKKNTREFSKFLKEIPRKKIDHAYADGKWTIREILQHVMDAERVFAYRALSFARKDPSPLPGFDENSWAANAGAAKRKWGALVEEFKDLRKSTEHLFGSFTDEQLRAVGTANGNAVNVLALGFLPAGHALHHMRIIQERYL
jgi:benzoyl-CoA reductase/2-hydroxyglutaryl-CoA dehydratase subunit BcrC/BadD/HgdB